MDLEYVVHFHDSHNDYPLAVEHLTVTRDMSKYIAECVFDKQSSLVPNQYNKVKYVTHIKNLKLYKHLGLVLTKIRRVLEFQQFPLLKSYINFNTDKRKAATSDFQKNFFKLMSNSVYGPQKVLGSALTRN